MAAQRNQNSERSRAAVMRPFTLGVAALVCATLLWSSVAQTANRHGPGSGHLVSELRQGSARFIVAVGGSYLDRSRIEKLYRGLVAHDLPQRFVAVVTAYPDDETEQWMEDGHPFHGFSFDLWRDKLLQVRREHPWRAVRLLATSDGVVIQVAKDDRFSSTVLAGADPTRFVVNGENYELLWLESRSQSRGEAVLEATFRSQSVPTVGGTRLLAEAVRSKLPADRLHLVVRPDIWFVYGGLPLWFAFVPQEQPPSWGEFRGRVEMYCDSTSLPLRCGSHTVPASPRLQYGVPLSDLK